TEHDGTSVNLVRGFGTSGDTITLSFSILCASDVDEVVVEASDLHIADCEIADRKIAADNIEVYIAKIWEQAGLGRKQGKKMQVRELLVKDDRQPLTDRYRRGYKHWRQFSQTAMFYCPPDVRLEGPAKTTLAAG